MLFSIDYLLTAVTGSGERDRLPEAEEPEYAHAAASVHHARQGGARAGLRAGHVLSRRSVQGPGAWSFEFPSG